MDAIWEAIEGIFNAIKNLVIKFINGILNFAKNVLGFFRGLKLKQGRDVPFLANANSPEFKAMLKQAPKKSVGIFQGTFNEETDEIDHYEYVQADSLDEQTRNVMGDEKLVVLS